jgi:hypothetical protein
VVDRLTGAERAASLSDPRGTLLRGERDNPSVTSDNFRLHHPVDAAFAASCLQQPQYFGKSRVITRAGFVTMMVACHNDGRALNCYAGTVSRGE